MFRVWGRIIKDNHLIKDTVICIDDISLSRTAKVYKALDDMCYELDLSRPIWLNKNKEHFKKTARTRFTQDNFIDTIEFDYLDFRVIEEDSYF